MTTSITALFFAASFSVIASGACLDVHELHARHAAAQKHSQTDVNVAGSWTMSFAGHDGFTAGLVLEQDGTKLTGTFTSPHDDSAVVEGDCAGGRIAFQAGAGRGMMTFTGKAQDKDTLAGSLSGPMGDMNWTAVRNKSAKH